MMEDDFEDENKEKLREIVSWLSVAEEVESSNVQKPTIP